MSNFIADFRLVFIYYTRFSSSPIDFTHLWTSLYSTKEKAYKNRRRQYLYLFTRLFPLINFIQVVRLLLIGLWELYVTGTGDVYGIFGLLLWLGVIIPLICYDSIFLKRNFLRSLLQSIDVCDKVWERASNHLKQKGVVTHLDSKKSFDVWSLLFHTCAIDFFSLFNFGWNNYQDIENDPTMMYASIPWKSPVVDVVYWCLQQINFITLCAAWSFMLSFPAFVAYHLECVIRALTESVKAGLSTSYDMEAVLKDYSSIEYALIKNGASWNDSQLFLLDLLVTTARMFHGLYALSRVDLASQSFLESIRHQMNQNAGENRMRSMKSQFIKKMLRSWANTNNITELENFLSEDLQVFGCRGRYWTLMTELTATASDVLTRPQLGLRGMAQDVNRNVTLWFRRKSWYSRAMAIASDFFLGNNLIEMAIKANAHQAVCNHNHNDDETGSER